jgi:hypothetical protein
LEKADNDDGRDVEQEIHVWDGVSFLEEEEEGIMDPKP